VHLKDNNSDVNLPLAPGKGTIPWAPLLRGLRAAGYAGSWDIEIGCAPERVEAEYLDGLNYLKSLIID
jgi:sugar phosphate isomerase/epimerase